MEDQELVYVDVEANLCQGLAYVAGRLKVTEKRLVFEPEPASRASALELRLDDIKKADAIPAMRWLPSGLSVTTYSGVGATFLVHRNDAIAKVIGLIQSDEGVCPL